MSDPIRLRKILWAVNPFEQEKSVLLSAARAIRSFARRRGDAQLQEGIEVQPVYAWAGVPDNPNWASSEQSWQAFEKRAQEEINHVLQKIAPLQVLPLKILSQGSFTLQQQVRELVVYAKEQQADLIVLCTHGRKGVKRLFLGSFAESLTSNSDLPLLIVHPSWNREIRLEKILFPTDFSEESNQAFLQVLDFASQNRSQVILFHKLGPPPLPTTFDPLLTGFSPYLDQLAEETRAMEKQGIAWARQALARKVQVQVQVDDSRTGSVAEGVVAKANELDCLIAMASFSGARSGMKLGVMLGGTTAKVIRAARQPLWVIHPRLTDAIALQKGA